MITTKSDFTCSIIQVTKLSFSHAIFVVVSLRPEVADGPQIWFVRAVGLQPGKMRFTVTSHGTVAKRWWAVQCEVSGLGTVYNSHGLTARLGSQHLQDGIPSSSTSDTKSCPLSRPYPDPKSPLTPFNLQTFSLHPLKLQNIRDTHLNSICLNLCACGYWQVEVSCQERNVCGDAWGVWFHQICHNISSVELSNVKAVHSEYYCNSVNHNNNIFHSYKLSSSLDHFLLSGTQSINMGNPLMSFSLYAQFKQSNIWDQVLVRPLSSGAR